MYVVKLPKKDPAPSQHLDNRRMWGWDSNEDGNNQNVKFGSTESIPAPDSDTLLSSPIRDTNFYGGAHSSPYYRNNLINLEKCN